MEILRLIGRYHVALGAGLVVTLELCLVVWTIGIVLGSGMGIASAKWPAFSWLSKTVAFFLSGIPILVLLFWLHYPLQSMIGVVIPPFITASVALSLVNTFGVAELVRTSLRDFPKQYLLAAKASGLPDGAALRYIEFPLIVRSVLPPLLVLQINMLQATLFASLISVDEIFRAAQRINAIEYKPVEIYTGIAVFFLAICLPLNGVALWLRQRFTRDLSEA